MSINQAIGPEKWPAPAKLNLMLRITGQREDGYHLLQTIFQFVELCDWLQFHSTSSGEVRLHHTLPGVREQDDLTVRAARLLQSATGCRSGVTIEVEKNLPMGGGLGGGSSDAATTLVVLNKLWGLNLPQEKLLELGLSLGADVPVFIGGHAAWAEGVGEKIEQISVPEQWVVIIKPECHVETKEIFSAKDLTRSSKSIKMRDFLQGDCQNDCLQVVSERYPPVQDALNDLAIYSKARLTGTGACVFAEFADEGEAQRAFHELSKKWLAYFTKGVNVSPLYAKLNNC